MERESNLTGPRRDEQLKREVASLTHGTPAESRAEDERLMEGSADDEPSPEAAFSTFAPEPDGGDLGYRDVRARSELARHLRPSIFPANRAAVLACARDEDAPEAVLEALERLPDAQFVNVEAVWEALGGAHERRSHTTDPQHEVEHEAQHAAQPEQQEKQHAAQPEQHEEQHAAQPEQQEERPGPPRPRVRRFAMRFDWLYRLAALPFAITPESAHVDVSDGQLEARFGLWAVETPLSNVAGVEETGPYHILTTIGPPHVSLTDGGLTFASNPERGLCIRFFEPVRGIDLIGLVLHPALTVTVDDIDGLRDALEAA